jgi:hypothetical protein
MTHARFLVLGGLVLASPAFAEVKSQSDAGFISGHSAEVLAKPEDVWKRLIAPKDWWSPSHSWSGSTAGFYIDAQAGGCFCEIINDKGSDGTSKPRGSVEHMRVLFADPGKVLRMQGALGPLQSEAVLATLTVAMEPLKDGAGTRLSFSYVVGGYTRFPMDKMAVAVDGVLAEQFAGLVKPLGKVVAAAEKPADAKADGTKADGEEWVLDPAKLEEKKPDDKAQAAKPKAEPEKPKTGKPEMVEADSDEEKR